MNGKQIGMLLTALLLASSLGGCVQSGPMATSSAVESTVAQEEEKGSGENADVTEITYWTWEGGNTKVQERFHEVYPQYRLLETKLASASDYTTKIQQAVASGSELPDILLGEASQRGALFAIDIWEDLSKEPYNAKLGDYFDYMADRGVNAKGEFVGIEQSVSPSAMAYKRDLVIKYFGTDDRAELESQLSTMDDYIEAAARISEESGGQDYLFASSGHLMEWLSSASTQPNMNAAGEIVYTEKITPILEQICALRDAGGIDTFTNWTPQCNAAYADYHHIFYPCANWDIVYRIKGNDAEGSGNWGLMMPPGGGYSHGGTVMGIYKDSPRKEAAWTYINWYVNTQDGADTVKKEGNYYVPTKKFYEDPDFTSQVDEFFAGQDIGDLLYNEITPNMIAMPLSQYDNVVWDVNLLLAQSLMADPSLDAETLVMKGVEEIQNKLPDVTVK